MSGEEKIVCYTSDELKELRKKDTLANWDALHAMTDEEIEERALKDPDSIVDADWSRIEVVRMDR